MFFKVWRNENTPQSCYKPCIYTPPARTLPSNAGLLVQFSGILSANYLKKITITIIDHYLYHVESNTMLLKITTVRNGNYKVNGYGINSENCEGWWLEFVRHKSMPDKQTKMRK